MEIAEFACPMLWIEDIGRGTESEMRELAGLQALVSGAASAVGGAVVGALARDGASVIAVDDDETRVEAAVAALALDDPDGVVTRGLDRHRVGGWWDLANLVAAYFHALDLFVYVAPADPTATCPDPEESTLSSLRMAVERLGGALAEAAREHGRPARVVVVAPGESAAIRALLAELERAAGSRGDGFGFTLLGPAGRTSDAVAAEIVDRARAAERRAGEGAQHAS